MTPILHSVASRVRHSPLVKPVEPVFRRIEPIWNGTMDSTVYRNGFPTKINGESVRLTYGYGSRYSKVGRYEPDIALPFAEAVRPGATVFDIGAHIGILALIAAQRAGSGGRVFAFEPSPDTIRVLRQHVRLNADGAPIEVIPAVVSDRRGSMTFFTYGESMAASISRANVEVLNEQRLTAPATEVTVEAVTIDDFAAEHGVVPDVIKIDIEGAELRALRGAERTLREHSPVIFCEIHPNQMRNCGDSVEELRAYVESLGYSLTPLTPPGHQGIYPSRITRR